jgi:hypothetical protein
MEEEGGGCDSTRGASKKMVNKDKGSFNGVNYYMAKGHP